MAGRNPKRWIIAARLIGLAWLLGVVVPYALSKPTHPDFPQLYMAGAIAIEGQWQALYPQPIEGAEVNPAYAKASTPHPDYVRIMEERGVPDRLRFIYPPPVAMLLAPMGLLSYRTALVSFAVVSAVAVALSGILAGWVYRKILGEVTWVEALLVLIACFSPAAVDGMLSMNISLQTGAVLGIAIVAMLGGLPGGAVWGVPFSGVFKAASMPIALLMAVMGHWRTLIGVLCITLVIIGAAILMMGTDPFEIFFGQIAPAVAGKTSPELTNQSISGFLSRHQLYSPQVGRIIGLFGLGTLLWIAWRVFRHRRVMDQQPVALASAMLAGLLVMMLCGPMFWVHYHMVLVPLWGLLAWDVLRSWRRGQWVWLVLLVGCWVSIAFPAIAWLQHRIDSPPTLLAEHTLVASLILVGRYLVVLHQQLQPEAGD